MHPFLTIRQTIVDASKDCSSTFVSPGIRDSLNAADLQIEGLCLAILAINHLLVEKGCSENRTNSTERLRIPTPLLTAAIAFL